MHRDILIVLILIIVVLAVIISDLTTGMLIASMLANIVLLCISATPAPVTALPPAAAPVTVPAQDMYGPFYDRWHSYHTSYSDCYKEPHIINSVPDATNYSVDAAAAYVTQQRTRDKKCSDGWAMKDANYARYHYGGELDDAENRVWWGRTDW